jgi:aspartate/glutamate/glutamine transport system permease protein
VFTIFSIIAATYFILNYALSVVVRNQQQRMVNQSY